MRYITICLLALLLNACDHIDREDRLIYEKPVTTKRAVLLEDFTGQRCVNCPKGTEVIEQLVAEYGDTAVVAVGIHSGPLGFSGNGMTLGLATETGDEYYYHWNLEYQPVGLVNRHGAVNYPEWAAAVKEELSKPASITLSAKVSAGTDNALHINITTMATDGTCNGKLQVWVLEDGITALQMMPDGTTNTDYVHNHVFRQAVNGTWGENITIKEGETNTREYTQAIDPVWNVKNLSIVAFVYNDYGVLQVAKAHLR